MSGSTCSACARAYPGHNAHRCDCGNSYCSGVCAGIEDRRACVNCRTAPAWLDAPDGEGYWWVRGRTYDRIVSVSLMATDPPRWRATGDDEDWEAGAKNGYQWQRVAPPREG